MLCALSPITHTRLSPDSVHTSTPAAQHNCFSACFCPAVTPAPILRGYQVLVQAGVWPGPIRSSSTAWTSVYTIN